jgi:adenylate kinase family enzyme
MINKLSPSLSYSSWYSTVRQNELKLFSPARVNYRPEMGRNDGQRGRSLTIPGQRIVIIGSSGSGKSTLARALGSQLNMNVIHLDQHFWQAGWIPTDSAIWTKHVQKMVQAPSWIIDGNYRNTLSIRLQAADTIVFLDMPRLVCMWRAIKRRVQYAYTERPDMAYGCDEQIFDPSLFSFLRRIFKYPYRARPDVVSRLAQLRPDQQLFWLSSNQEVVQFLAQGQQASFAQVGAKDMGFPL